MIWGGVEIVFTIIVDKEGHSNFSTVWAALDVIDDYNKRWIRVEINLEIYV